MMDKVTFIQQATISNMQGLLEGAGLKGLVFSLAEKKLAVSQAVDLASIMWEELTNRGYYGTTQ